MPPSWLAPPPPAASMHAAAHAQSSVRELEVVVGREVGLEGVGRRLRGGGDRAATRAWQASAETSTSSESESSPYGHAAPIATMSGRPTRCARGH